MPLDIQPGKAGELESRPCQCGGSTTAGNVCAGCGRYSFLDVVSGLVPFDNVRQRGGIVSGSVYLPPYVPESVTAQADASGLVEALRRQPLERPLELPSDWAEQVRWTFEQVGIVDELFVDGEPVSCGEVYQATLSRISRSYWRNAGIYFADTQPEPTDDDVTGYGIVGRGSYLQAGKVRYECPAQLEHIEGVTSGCVFVYRRLRKGEQALACARHSVFLERVT